MEEGLRELKSQRAERFTIKSLERTKRGLEAKLKKLQDSSRKDDVVTFEQLGVDRLYVDEAHNYKNLFLYTKMRNVAGLSATDAQKSSDMLLKCRYIDEITDSRGVVFATGTPRLKFHDRIVYHDALSPARRHSRQGACPLRLLGFHLRGNADRHRAGPPRVRGTGRGRGLPSSLICLSS